MSETQKTPIAWWHHAVIALILVGITAVSFWTLKNSFENLSASNWEKVSDIQQSNVELAQAHPSDSLHIGQHAIISKKVDILEQQKNQYLDLLKVLYKNYYALLTLFPFLSGLAAIIAFFIMQTGWKSAGGYIKTIFVVVTFLAALVGIFPEVYQQEANIKRYSNAYVQYAIIQKDLYDYSLSAPWIGDRTIQFDAFLREVNLRERSLIDLHLGLQKKEITSDVFDIQN